MLKLYIYIERENYVIYIQQSIFSMLKNMFSFRTIKNRFYDSNKKKEREREKRF